MDIGAAILGGLVGGGVMIALLYMGMMMMPQQMKMNLLLLLGTMLVPVGAAAYMVGLMMHAMLSIGFGAVHGLILDAADVTSGGDGALLGIAIGLAHAVIVGMALGMMPMLHPRLRGSTPSIPMLPKADAGEDVLDPPGFFGFNYPMPTVAGFFMLHALFGVIAGLIYGA